MKPGARVMNPAFAAARSRSGAVDHIRIAMQKAIQTGAIQLSQMNLKEIPEDCGNLALMEGDANWWETNPITKIDISNNYLIDLPDRLAIFADMKVFNAMFNSFSVVPSVIMSFDKLRSINLSKNKLICLPDLFVASFPELNVLNLNDNQLTSLPDAFGALQNLTELSIANNKLSSLPESLFEIRSLSEFDLSNNELNSIPSAIENLSGCLLKLNLSKNKLTRLNEGFKRLLRLKELNLSTNLLEALTNLPHSSHLKLVDASVNRLITLHPSTFTNSPNITELFLRRNRLTEIECITDETLPKLVTLDVSDNDISDLPDGLGLIDSLIHFNQDGNRIRCIRLPLLRGSINALKIFLKERYRNKMAKHSLNEHIADAWNKIDDENLRKKEEIEKFLPGSTVNHEVVTAVKNAAISRNLVLSNTPISSIPPSLAALSEVISVDVSLVPIVDLPQNAVGGDPDEPLWPNVRNVSITSSLIAFAPRVMTRWNQLQSLNLSSSKKLTMLFDPLTLTQNSFHHVWPNLKSLNLSHCNLNGIPKEIMSACPNLISLDVSYNRLTSWGPLESLTPPHTPLRNGFTPISSTQVVFPQLQELNVAGNQFDHVPVILPLLIPSLLSLNLSNNAISNIPTYWGKPEGDAWKNLRVLDITGNPQRVIKSHILSKGTRAVLEFLANRDAPRISSKDATEEEVNEGLRALGRKSVPNAPEASAYLRAAEDVLTHRMTENRPLKPFSSQNDALVYAAQIKEEKRYNSGDPRLVDVPYFERNSENEDAIRLVAKDAAAAYKQRQVQDQKKNSVLNNVNAEADVIQKLLKQEKELLQMMEGVGISQKALHEAKINYARIHAERVKLESGSTGSDGSAESRVNTPSIGGFSSKRSVFAEGPSTTRRSSVGKDAVLRNFF